MWSSKWTILWSLWAMRFLRQPTLPVQTSSGLVRGLISPDGTYKQYMSIPYATSNRETRFKAPGPAPQWEGIFEAVNENIRCPQTVLSESRGKAMLGQEDCLILNVHTPIDAQEGDDLPVMAFIHGGGFFEGSASNAVYGPGYLVPKGVILVTFNYRLNIQGFLCLRTKDAPGNAALKDQAAALRWIQRNIKAFGGNPDSVTLFGESAGASSVSLHLLSPMSKGLFHKAIMQSGTALADWAFQFSPLYIATLTARVLGYNSEDPHELYDIFKDKTDQELVTARVPRLKNRIITTEILYVPCVEDVIDGVEPFLTDTPYNLLSKGEYNKVPIIIGSNSCEGYFILNMENSTIVKEIRLNKSLPKNLHVPIEIREEVGEQIRRYYMGDEEDPVGSRDWLLKLGGFYTDTLFVYPVLDKIDLLLKAGDQQLYSYLFKYDGRRNLPKILLQDPYRSVPGATHADDLLYMFDQLLPSLFEDDMINKLTTLWTNFAKYGDPTPVVTDLIPAKWYPTNTSSPYRFVIDKEFGVEPLWKEESLRMWRDIFTKYRRKI